MSRVSKLLSSLSVTTGFSNKSFKNNFFYALVVLFNGVCRERIREVGPDRACAEWLMKNGAIIKWKDDIGYVTNYNALPLDKNITGPFLLKEVNATDSGISYHGFPHFENCEHVDFIKLVNCGYIEDRAVKMLATLKNSLESLEMSDCVDVSDEGMMSLSQLKNLKTLTVGHMEGVRDMEKVLVELKKTLPDLKIIRLSQN